MPFINTSSKPAVRLSYTDQGTGQPIVLVHCWPLSGQVWAQQVAALTAAGFRCVTYDRRGFGDSGHPDGGYDYDTFAADLHDLISALDLRNVILAGYSMGGGEVVRYITRYGTDRIAKVMLIATVLPFPLLTDDNPGGVPMPVYDGLMAAIAHDHAGFIEGIGRAFVDWSAERPDDRADALERVLSLARRSSPVATAACVRAFGTTDFRAEIAAITLPALVVHGTTDQMVPAESSSLRLTAMLPQSQLVLIEGGPHGIAVTHAAELSDAMLAFARA